MFLVPPLESHLLLVVMDGYRDCVSMCACGWVCVHVDGCVFVTGTWLQSAGWRRACVYASMIDGWLL